MTCILIIHMFNILQHRELDLRLSWTFSSSGKNLSEEDSNISSFEVKLYSVCSYVKENQSYSHKNSLANTFCKVRCSTEPVTDSVGKKRQVIICPCNSFLRSPSSSHCEWRAPASCASVCLSLVPGTDGSSFCRTHTILTQQNMWHLSREPASWPLCHPAHWRPFTLEGSCYFWPASTSL